MGFIVFCAVLVFAGFVVGAFCMWLSMRRDVAAAQFLNERMSRKIAGLEKLVKTMPLSAFNGH